MESSKAFDVPHGVLPPEIEKRLARVFCFLRQHERKARAARKVAELQRLSLGASAHASARVRQRQEQTDASNTDDGGGKGSCSSADISDHADFADQSGRGSLDNLEDTYDGSARAFVATNGAGAGSSPVAATAIETAIEIATATTRTDQRCLLSELSLLSPEHSCGGSYDTSSKTTTTNASASHQQRHGTHALMLELRREIRELQKGILPVTLSVCGADSAATGIPGCITAADIVSAMKAMNRTSSKIEAQWMIWEADDDLDGCIDWDEFRSCYARSLVDKHGLEPNQLYHLVQFLLCDTGESYTVSVLELKAELKKLPGTDHLASKLLVALKDDAEQQMLQKFTLSEYLDVILGDLPPAFAKFY